ncbi:MAG: hypothetical protein Tsb0017_26020 [Geothermobacteraceae bacterium]
MGLRHEVVFKRFTLALALTPLAPGPVPSLGKNRGVGRWASGLRHEVMFKRFALALDLAPLAPGLAPEFMYLTD